MQLIPLKQRLQRTMYVALLLGLWGGIKVGWEQSMAHEQNELRYGRVEVTQNLRDQMGQAMTIAVLSGMRSLVADCLWLKVTGYWEDQDWFHMANYIYICNILQPRCETFWSEGGCHIAWDAACEVRRNTLSEPNPYRRRRVFLYWVDQGKDVLLRGLDNLPQSWVLWQRLAMLYDEHLQDEDKAADAYEHAAECPNAPVYLERFSAYSYEREHNDTQAYLAWSRLYHKLTPKQLEDPIHWGDKIEQRIRTYEKKLNVLKEKRIFP